MVPQAILIEKSKNLKNNFQINYKNRNPKID